MLRSRLCGQRLADTGRAEQVNDEPVTLALDEIVELKVGFVSFDERAEQGLSVGRQDEVRERFVVPFNLG